MKKILLIAAAALISASVFAQTVTSANIVGYVKVDTVGGEFTMPGGQFMIGTGNTISETLGTNSLPLGTKVYKWTGVGYKEIEYTYLVDLVGFPPAPVTNGVGWTEGINLGVSDATLDVGEGYWIANGGAAGTTNVAVIAGEVVMDAEVTNTISEGFNMICSPYPVETAVTNFGFNASLGDKIYIWTGVGYAEVEYTYLVDLVGFPPAPVTNGVNWTEGINLGVSDKTAEVGQGFWYESGVSTNWIANKPF